MANETELANFATKTDEISDGISAAIVKHTVAVPLIYKEDLPTGTATKEARKAGSLASEAIAESGAYSFSASSEYTETSVTATAAKEVVVSKLTVEALQFSGAGPDKIIDEQAMAIARGLDDDILALSSGASNAVTSSSTLTASDVVEAVWTVRANRGGAAKLAGLFDAKGIQELVQEMYGSTGTPLAQPGLTTLLGDDIAATGYVGDLPGVSIYHADGLPLDTADDVAMVFNPMTAFFGMYSPSVQTNSVWVGSGGFYWEIASHVFSKVVEWNDEAICAVKSDT